MAIIETKYLPATNTKGSRIKACDRIGNSVTIDYPYELSGSNCHKKAAMQLLAERGSIVTDDFYIADTKHGYIFTNVKA